MKKRCPVCKKKKPVEDFNSQGKCCRECHNERNRQWREKHPEVHEECWRKFAREIKRKKANNEDVSRWILYDSRSSDRKRGLKNDLDRDFIEGLICSGCQYCGEKEIRMTLDRIDNQVGHTRDNVVPSCIRCNYARRDMPYQAWLVVAKGMAEARSQGLFGDWTGRVK